VNGIHYLAYPGEHPVFDFTNLLIGHCFLNCDSHDNYDPNGRICL